MFQADLNHPSASLQAKLQSLFSLNRGKALDLSFRPPFLKLLEKFGNPHLHLPPVIHIAGTNGKGSTIAMLRSILQTQGYKVHVYTSPHLHHFNERIVLAGEIISDEVLEPLLDEALKLNDGADITFFEITTALAFAAFRRHPADIVLLETGLGGRLDCTNIIPAPHATVISAISYDHTEFLGHTIEDIAREKAGIIKAGAPCILGYQPLLQSNNAFNPAVDIIVDQARDKNSPVYCATQDWSIESNGTMMTFKMGRYDISLPQPNLSGIHQIHNAGLALATLHILRNEFPVERSALEQGLRQVHWPARLEKLELSSCIIPEGWEIIYDGGHNDSAGAALARQAALWKDASAPKSLHIILGMKGDKDPAAFLKDLLAFTNSLTLTSIEGIGTCVKTVQIEPLLPGHSLEFLGQQDNLNDAIHRIVDHSATNTGRILICGSLYLADKIKSQLLS